jgi:hypothetical protein
MQTAASAVWSAFVMALAEWGIQARLLWKMARILAKVHGRLSGPANIQMQCLCGCPGFH